MTIKQCEQFLWWVIFFLALGTSHVNACHYYCSGFEDWWCTNCFICADPGGGCIGLEFCGSCIYRCSFGTCVPGGTGECETNTWGYTKMYKDYRHEDAGLVKKALCYAAWLLHHNDTLLCICNNTGECLLENVEYLDWDSGCS
jgi:hypothetical protein